MVSYNFNSAYFNNQYVTACTYRTNRTLYTPVSLRPLPSSYKPSLVELPSTQPQSADEEQEEREEEEENEEERDPLAPLADGLVTLSLLPKSRWYNLHNLDIIKV